MCACLVDSFEQILPFSLVQLSRASAAPISALKKFVMGSPTYVNFVQMAVTKEIPRAKSGKRADAPATQAVTGRKRPPLAVQSRLAPQASARKSICCV